MIKINRPNLHILAQKHYQEFFVGRGFRDRLEQAAEDERDLERKSFLDRLWKWNEKIIKGNPVALAEILAYFKEHHESILTLLQNTKVTPEARKKVNPAVKKYDPDITPTEESIFCALIEHIFRYDLFVAEKDSDTWGAYWLMRELQVNVCPYCNRLYTTTYRTEEDGTGSTRPEFDHFYPQSKYPFFAVSFTISSQAATSVTPT